MTRSRVWILVVAGLAAPVLLVLCSILWRTPYPLSEGVAILEDVADPSQLRFLDPATAYYRPLFFLTLFSAWHSPLSLDGFLAAVKLFHIVPVTLLVVLLIAHLRPAYPAEAAAATVALAVLIGSPAFLDNIEIPLTYTIVGMACALAAWILMERDAGAWHAPAIVALTLIAVGFKEQGLIIVPVIVVAWWMGAPGVKRTTVGAVVLIAVAYLVVRLGRSSRWAPFEQDIGFGFTLLAARDAAQRFGAFPLWIYLYNGASTILNVLCAEPTAGVFSITRALVRGEVEPWQIVYVASSITTTALIVWWATGAIRRSMGGNWTREARLAGALVTALAASGVLSFNYSRDRLGGMALVFYVLATFAAIRAVIGRVENLPRLARASAAVALLLLASAWQVRTVHTLEFARRRAANSQREWITDLHERRLEFATRPSYLRLMEDLVPQGTAKGLARPTGYPGWVFSVLGPFLMIAANERGFLPAFLMAPPLLIALTLCAVEGYRVVRPDADLFVQQPQVSLADAILHGTVEQAFAFIRDGQDPNALIAVQDPDFANDRPMQVSPMVLAVAARQANVVTMLLGAGARIDLPANALAICLADELGDDEVREVLRQLPTEPLPRCPEHVLEP